jgi:hypothetical protein
VQDRTLGEINDGLKNDGKCMFKKSFFEQINKGDGMSVFVIL